jgi:pimeloyl-ACP methyl ester carboxylesterase
MFAERSWEGGDVPLNVAGAPSAASPLLLLHGVSRRWRCFDPILSALLPTWQILALDLRGHGRSGRADSYLVPDYVRDVAEFLRDGTPGPAVVYGHGIGALTALALAAEMPDRVRALVLEDPPIVSPAQLRAMPVHGFLAESQRLAGPGHSVAEVTRQLAETRVYLGGARVQVGEARHRLFLRFMARCLSDLDPGVLEPFVDGDWFGGFDPSAAAESVSCPVLLLRADDTHGGLMPRDDADRLAARLADCVCVDFPETGNLIHWFQPQTLVLHLLGFLGSL